MDQGTTLWRVQALGEEFALTLEAFGQWQLGCRLDCSDATQRREQPRHALGHLGVLGADQRLVVDPFETMGLFTRPARAAAFAYQPTRISQAGLAQITLEQLVDDVVLDRLRRTDGCAADNHVQRLLNPCQTRQALGTTGTG